MNQIYIATGYDSYIHQLKVQAFETEAEADNFINSLTEPHILVIAYESVIDLVNNLIKGN